MDSFSKRIVVGVLAVSAVFFIAAAVMYMRGQKPLPEKQLVTTEKEQITETQRLLATNASDPTHINNIGYIQYGLEQYFKDKRAYPTKLEELVPLYIRGLPAYSSEQGYFYAYSPSKRPTSYHLGSPLGGRNEASPKALGSDADFNSEKTGYVGGFNGADPVYDITGGKK